MPHHPHTPHPPPAPETVAVAIVTVSDTRTPRTDEGGNLAAALCCGAGFTRLERRLVRDDPEAIGETVRSLCDDGGAAVVLVTGGTGISGRDRTVEAIAPLLDRSLDGFGELFRSLSFAEIGPAAILSRAMAGLRGTIPVFVMPGSPQAIRLAMERLILPELPHLLSEARRPT